MDDPPHLSSTRLFEATLPAAWRPILEGLAELDGILAERVAAEPVSAAELGALRRRILGGAGRIEEAAPATLRAESASHRTCFTEAVLLWPSFARAGGRVLRRTLETRTLDEFPVDFGAAEDPAVLKRALREMYGWSVEELEAIGARLARRASNLDVKHAIAAAIAARFDGHAGDPRAQALALMTEMYGPLPLRPGDVDLVLTTGAVFFALPYEGESFTGSDLGGRPAEEREAIDRFLHGVREAQKRLKNERFPAFGLFDRSRVSPALLGVLSERVRAEPSLAGASDEIVLATLSTMVTILPAPEADKYLVHDVWGHGWQESLSEFEWLYADLDRLRAPLGPWLRAAFEERPADGRLELRPEHLARSVEADLRERIALGLGYVVSECLADVVEHKVARRLGRPLPSSSIFPDRPIKLDLSLRDARLVARAWSGPYLRFVEDPAERRRACDAPDEALEAAAELIRRRFGPVLDPSMVVAEEGGLVRASLLARVELGIATLDAAIERFLDEGDAHWGSAHGHDPIPRWRCPRSSMDLLVLALGWFYEQERETHIWHLDELVREIGKSLARLEHALGHVLS